MKLKNISFLDKHLHKIVPAVAMVFLLGVIYFYVVGEPYRVPVDKSFTMLTPLEVEGRLRDAAAQLDRKINHRENPLPPLKLIPYTEEFQARARRSLVGKAMFEVPLGQPGLDPKVFAPEAPVLSKFLMALPPPATDLKVRPDYGVLAPPQDKDQAKEWVKLVGNREPRDIHIVTISGTFDMAEWRRRLAVKTAGSLIRIPEDWWRPRLAITDVIVERQTLDPQTGQWGSPEQIDLLPNDPFVSLRALGEDIGSKDPVLTVQMIRLEQEQITHRVPPPLTADHPWQPPSVEVQLNDEQVKKLQSLKEEIETLNERIARMGGAPTGPPTTPPPSGGVKATGGRPVPTSGARASGPAPIVDPASDLAKYTKLRDGKIAEREAIRTGKSLPKPDQHPAGAGSDAGAIVVAADKIDVWAHDVTAKPGVTYRYRLLISVLNPLFQRQNLDPEQREDYYQRLALTSDPDGEEVARFKDVWSGPVTVDKETYFFVTNANPSGRSVTVVVWRLINGAWRSKEFNVQPGDPIGDTTTLAGIPRPVDMTVNAVAVDIDFSAPVISHPLMQTTAKLIYFDNATGKLLSRTIATDRDDPRHMRLKGQTHLGSVAEAP